MNGIAVVDADWIRRMTPACVLDHVVDFSVVHPEAGSSDPSTATVALVLLPVERLTCAEHEIAARPIGNVALVGNPVDAVLRPVAAIACSGPMGDSSGRVRVLLSAATMRSSYTRRSLSVSHRVTTNGSSPRDVVSCRRHEIELELHRHLSVAARLRCRSPPHVCQRRERLVVIDELMLVQRFAHEIVDLSEQTSSAERC